MFLFFGAPLSGMTSIPGFPSDDYDAYITGMIVVMAVVFNGADVAFTLLTDMLSGYFDKLLLAPVNRFSILMGTLLISGTRALVQVLVILAMALALGVSFKGGLVGLVAIIVAATVFGIATACIGLIIALRTRSVQVTQNSWLMFMPLAFLTTAFMPKELLTGWFKWAVTLNPVDYVLVSVRDHHHRRMGVGLDTPGPMGPDRDHGDHAHRRHLDLPPRHRLSLSQPLHNLSHGAR